MESAADMAKGKRFDVHFIVVEKCKGKDALATFRLDSHGRPAPG